MTILEYIDDAGRSPFADWFDDLDPVAAVKVTIALARMENGNLAHANPSARGFRSTGSISARATGCISGETARR